MSDMKTRLISSILKAHKRSFATKGVFIRYIQFEPSLSIISRVEIEQQMTALQETGIISILSDPEPFLFEVTLPSIPLQKNASDLFNADNLLSPRTINEIRGVLREVQPGDQIFFSTYAGTTFLDEFVKEFENCLLQPNVRLHLMMLGKMADPVLREVDPAKFERVIANAYQAWVNLQHMVGRERLELRQCQGLAGVNRCLIVTDSEGNIKYYGYLLWQMGKRGVDGLYLSSFLSDLNMGRLLLQDFRMKWQSATSHNGKIFLCHSSKDKEFTRRLFRRLQEDDIPVWFDEKDILAGEDFIKQMEQGIQLSDYVGVVISPAFLKGPWAQREYRTALEKEVALNRVHVIPLYKATVPIDQYPTFLKTKSYADFRNSFHKGYEKLLRSLQELPMKVSFAE